MSRAFIALSFLAAQDILGSPSLVKIFRIHRVLNEMLITVHLDVT